MLIKEAKCKDCQAKWRILAEVQGKQCPDCGSTNILTIQEGKKDNKNMLLG